MKSRTTAINNLADRIARVHRDHPVRVGIDGFAAAGKTMLSDELVAPLEQRGRVVLRVSIDGFHNPAEIRHIKGRHCPVGYYQDSFNHEAIVRHVLAPLGPNGNRTYQPASYDSFRAAVCIWSKSDLISRCTSWLITTMYTTLC